MKLNAIIVEDEAESRAILKNYITKYCPCVILLGEAENITEAEKLIQKHELDIVFLDVEMPYGNAFDLLEKLTNISFETIFVTAYDHYAIDALNHQASYYLLKPISIDDLILAVDNVKLIKETEKTLHQTVIKPKNDVVKNKITIPQLDGFKIIETTDILYCKADDNYTEIYLSKGKLVASKTLKHFEGILQEFGFARIHKSYVVNVNAIVRYKKGKGGSVELINGKELPVAPSKKGELLNYFK